MSIIVQCPGCGGKFRAPDEAAGKRVKCPKCSAPIEVSDVRQHHIVSPATAIVEKPSQPPPLIPSTSAAIADRREKSSRMLVYAWAAGGTMTILLVVGLLWLFTGENHP